MNVVVPTAENDNVAIAAAKMGLKHMAQVFSLNLASMAARVAKDPGAELCCHAPQGGGDISYDGKKMTHNIE
jgi:hypothetical protein